MKATKQLLLWATCICLGYITQAQMNPKQPGQKSYVKVNLLGLPIRNIGMQYEKTLRKRVSFALGYRFMPKGPIPFKTTLIEMSDNSADAQTAFNSIKFSNYAITPEIRIYAGKKAMEEDSTWRPSCAMACSMHQELKWTTVQVP